MDASDDHEELESRCPRGKASRCSAAILQHGFARANMDIDLLIDTSPENVEKIKVTMMCLPDGAAREVRVEDFDDCNVVRVADGVGVNLMKQACGIDYEEAFPKTMIKETMGVLFRMATLELFWKMRQTVRAKDEADRIFIQNKLAEREGED